MQKKEYRDDEELRELFRKLDSKNIGAIGAKNLEFRNIESDVLKQWDGLILEIFK